MRKNKYLMHIIVALTITASIGITACKSSADETKMSTDESSASSVAEESKEAKSQKNIKELDYKNLTVEDLTKNLIGKKELTDEEFLELVSTYRYVPITEDLNLEDGSVTQQAFSLLDDKNIKYTPSQNVLKTLIKSEYPQLRGIACELMDEFNGAKEENIDLVKEILKTEKEPYVLRRAISVVAYKAGEDPEIAKFLLDMAKNENPGVRERAAYWLCISSNKDIEGAKDLVFELMQDENKEVMRTACEKSGVFRDNQRITEYLKTILLDDSKYELHGICGKALIDMWLNPTYMNGHNETAYNATVEYIEKTSRNENIPEFTVLNYLSGISDTGFEEWKVQNPYYNKDKIIAAMIEIIKDPNANSLARASAIEVIHAHGKKEALASIKSVIEALTDKDASFIKDVFSKELTK